MKGRHCPDGFTRLMDPQLNKVKIESLRPSEADASVTELLRSGNAKRILGI